MRLGIRTRAILIPAAILLLAIAGNTIIMSVKFRNEHSRSLHANARVIGHKLKLQIERLLQLGIELREIEGYDEQCREVLREHEEVSYAAILDGRGTVLFEAGLPEGFRLDAARVRRGEAILTQDTSAEEYYNTLVAIDSPASTQQAWALVGFRKDLLDEKIARLAAWSITAATASIALAVTLMSMALSALVSRPILTLLRATREIRSSGDLSRRVDVQSGDELGTLATSFNELLVSIQDRDAEIHQHLRSLQEARSQLENRVRQRTAELETANAELQLEIQRRCEAEAVREKLHAELVDASRRAGMADVATGVLHNIGNVLNSVNVSAEMVTQQLRKSQLPGLKMAVELIDQNRGDLGAFCTNDQRGRHLPAFLAQLSQCLEEENQRAQQELGALASNVNHIKDIINMQQSLACTSAAIEEIDVDSTISDALRINRAGLERHRVQVVRQDSSGVRVTTDRHKLLQILINVISNAKYALAACSHEPRQITIRVDTDEQQVRIRISDNGMGIAAEHMDRLFNYGFTTRKEGHGFGLHSSALAAGEIGGSIDASSDGPGKGAEFSITIPRRFNGERLCTPDPR